MKIINRLCPDQRHQLRCLRARIANREYMRRVREARKLLCVGVDLPIDAGTCGRLVHAGYLRCIHCTRRRWWLLKHAFNDAEVTVTVIRKGHAGHHDVGNDLPVAVPLLDDTADPCLRW